MLLAVIWQVISRYILGSPSTLTDEIASFSLIWLGLFGAAYATGKQLHLAIDLIPSKIINNSPIFYQSIIAVSVIIFSLFVMVVGGTRLCWLTYILDQKSAALEIPLTFIYVAVPISGSLIIFYSIDTLKEMKNQNE
ncbi:TRAP transporter small permease [Aquimarina algicola]|uniref:TRAP transporter small permease n=2 Tax=Aquimarina algicola TaxID=2589995 RepID=A0A504ISE7_9FLAO|nr:TRAP transporter small permease [Aquimarina algicola]